MGGATVAATPLLRSLFSTLSAVFEPRVGLVVPASPRFAGLGDDIRDGVRAGLRAAARPGTRVLVREAGRAPSHVAAAARSLIERDRVDVVLAWANPAETRALGELAVETRTPIVLLDPGAHVVAEHDSRVLRHTLGSWQAAWALGSWSARSVGDRCFVVSSLYESGFDTYHAFAHGFERAGGTITGTAVTGLEDGDVAAAVKRAAASRSGLTMSLHTGEDAAEFAAAFADSTTAARGQLAMGGLGLPGAARSGVRLPSGGVLTCLGWPAEGSGEARPFFALGRDVGTLVASAASDGADALPSGESEIESRRGVLRVDLARGLTDVPMAIHRLTAAGIERVAHAGRSADADRHVASILPAVRTGWLDVYGCAS